jgi:hypothetical protein
MKKAPKEKVLPQKNASGLSGAPKQPVRLTLANSQSPGIDWKAQKTDRLIMFLMGEGPGLSNRSHSGAAMIGVAKAFEELALSRGMDVEAVSRWLPLRERGAPALGRVIFEADPEIFERLLRAGALSWEHLGWGERFRGELTRAQVALGPASAGVGALARAAVFESGRLDGALTLLEPASACRSLGASRPKDRAAILRGALAGLDALGADFERRGAGPGPARKDSALAAVERACGKSSSWPQELTLAWDRCLERGAHAAVLRARALPHVHEFSLALSGAGQGWREPLSRLAALGREALGVSLADPCGHRHGFYAMAPMGLALETRAWDAALETARAGAPWSARPQEGPERPFVMLAKSLIERRGPPAEFWGHFALALTKSLSSGAEAGQAEELVLNWAKAGLRFADGKAAKAALEAMELGMSTNEERPARVAPRL